MGPVCHQLTRMGFLLCMDGVPAFHGNHKGSPSLGIVELINLSLAPHLRYDPDNMLSWMLISDTMSTDFQLNFFDYVIDKEMNALHTTGVPGPDGPVSCRIFGTSLDLKGIT